MLQEDDGEKLKESLTEEHVELLELMDDPVKWFTQRKRPLPHEGGKNLVSGNVITHLALEAFPKYKTERSRIEKIYQDLVSFELLHKIDFIVSGSGIFHSRTTPRGKKVLKKIKDAEAGSQP